ncbi:MAG TPA: HNH endonuclease signature motif containing protein [Burkholderiales bacterium]|nr:HNH endonuclease signature motif containing protein [Burkholderiales bacterium]
MTSAFAGDLNLRSMLAVVGLTIVGGGLLAWALKQTTLEEAPDPRAVFMKRNPCPANGNTRGACPGYTIHHVKPLCAGGVDRASNMQWLTLAAAKRKVRVDAQQCRAYRKQQKRS